MRLRGGGSGHLNDTDAAAGNNGTLRDNEEEEVRANKSDLAALAMRLKAPFHELPPEDKTETYQVGLRDIADTLKEDSKDRFTVPV